VTRAVRRAGRRPGTSGSRDAILRAARRRFGALGYERTTIRGIAGEAGVDPALVLHFFGSKEDLFAESIRLVIDPGALVPAILAGPRTRLGERVVRVALELWGRPEIRDVFLSILRSAASNEAAAAALRRFITREVLMPLAEASGMPNAPLRAALTGSQIVGMAVARYVVKVEPLASADPDEVARWIGPTLQRYLTEPAPRRSASTPGPRSGP